MASTDEARAAFQQCFGAAPRAIVAAPAGLAILGEHGATSGLPMLALTVDGLLVLASPNNEPAVPAVAMPGGREVRFGRTGGQVPRTPWWAPAAGATLAQLDAVAPGRGAQLLLLGDEDGPGRASAVAAGVAAALDACWEAHLGASELCQMVGAAVSRDHPGAIEAIFSGEAGAALRVEQAPAACRAVPLPSALRLVAAALASDTPPPGSPDTASADLLIGARIAAALLADQVGLDPGELPLLADVRDVDVVDILADELPERMSPQEAAHGVNLKVARLTSLGGAHFDAHARVPVRRVARHMLAEAARLDRAEAALRAEDIPAFGEILDESHNSLRQELQLSTPAADHLCAAMRRAGALGARVLACGHHALAVTTQDTTERVIVAAVAATGGPAVELRPARALTVL
jgi:galactokinase